MIIINCCATCKYYNEEKSICMNRESYDTKVTSDGGCDSWDDDR